MSPICHLALAIGSLAATALAQTSERFALEAASSQPTAQTAVSSNFRLTSSLGATCGDISTDSWREIAAGILPHRLPQNLSGPLVDTDDDLLADGWELYYFGNLAQTAEGDPDGDGSNNANEQFAACDPRDPASRFLLHPLARVGASVALQWHGSPQKSYRVHYRSDLAAGSWTMIATVMTDAGGDAAFTDNDPARMALTRGFYMIELVRD